MIKKLARKALADELTELNDEIEALEQENEDLNAYIDGIQNKINSSKTKEEAFAFAEGIIQENERKWRDLGLIQ